MFYRLNQQYAIGTVVDRGNLQQAAEFGYRTVIDLCTAAEGNLLNLELVQESGLNLIHFPVSLQHLGEELVRSFVQTVELAATPVYTRCASGKRAGLLTFLAVAQQQQWTEQDWSQHLLAARLDLSSPPPLAEFAQAYLRTLQRQP